MWWAKVERRETEAVEINRHFIVRMESDIISILLDGREGIDCEWMNEIDR